MAQNSWLGRSFEELSRRKVVRAGATYAVVAWLAVQVADTVLPAFGGSDAAMRLIILGLLIGFPIVLILAWAYDLTGSGLKRTEKEAPAPSRGARTVDLVIMGALALAVGYLFFENRLSPRTLDVTANEGTQIEQATIDPGPSVAVLPFENLSDDTENEIFARGLAEDLLMRLAKIEALRVPGPTSSFRYDARADDISQIGRALKVKTLLAGSVQAYADTIRVTASLIDVSNGYTIWSENYTREMTNLFVIQEEIARQVTEKLKIELIGEAQDVRRPTASVDAYRLYLRGRNEWHKRTSTSLTKAVDLFQRAIALDPEYAAAWSGLADSYNFMSNYGNMESSESIEKATEAARKALELDPNLAEAHASLGLIYNDTGLFQQSAQAYEQAIELNPGYANAHMWYGAVLKWNDPEGALEQRRIAADLEPLSPIAVQLYGESLISLGRVDEARREFLKIVDFAPEYPLIYFELTRLALLEDDYVNALRYLRRANELDPGRAATMVAISQMYMLLGDLDTARVWIDQATETGPDQLEVIKSQLSMLQISGDFDGMKDLIERKLSDDNNFFPHHYFLSAIAFQNEEYAETARWIRQIFQRFSGSAGVEIASENYLINDETMLGVVYLANAAVRSGDSEEGTALASRLLVHARARAEAGLLSSQLLYVTAGAHIALGQNTLALETVERMADRGFAGYLQLENDMLFSPIRNELEFKVSVDYIRNNAQAQLAQINAI